jgi:CRISPR-associated protein Cas2
MSERTLHLAAYDVANPKRLRAALKLVQRDATGGQRSVYECFLGAAERAHLLHAMSEVIDPTEDRFLLIALDPRSRVHTLGVAKPPIDPDILYFS